MPACGADVQTLGLLAFEVTSGPMTRPHVHPEVELNLLLAGRARYEMSTAEIDLPRGRLVAFWGGYPHRLLSTQPVRFLGATVPLGGLAESPALRPLVDALLRGAVLVGDHGDGAYDRRLLARWRRDLWDGEGADVCMLEARARLARMVPRAAAPGLPRQVHTAAAERVLATIARRYTEPLTVARISAGAGVHPTYAALAFTEAFGMSIWRYVTTLRVVHAQRLLTSTDRMVGRIAYDSGFPTRSSFYRAFRQIAGTTPTAYRRAKR